MSDIAIKFENVSKLYELGTVGTGTLSHDLKRWWITSVLHKEDPYLKIGETNDRSTKGDSKFVYALKDIDFEVKQGDVLGIIGKNGAGKSTLLKLLSRVTAPTTGKIYTKGRIASLLEVGTGFHPELTGRENIYMNGTILGMKKWEIDRKLDEIVDFSGCERYLDTPVKRYSSGMMVRLGFAVAAHLEPEILVVDEVLAVGDAEFQKKAIGKMQDVSKGEGRTVLFVSHNMNAVRNLCLRGIVLENGMFAYDSDVNGAIEYYLHQGEELLSEDREIKDAITYLAPGVSIDNITFNGTTKNSTTIRCNQPYLDVVVVGHTTLPLCTDLSFVFRNTDEVALASYGEGHAKGLASTFPPGPFKIQRRIKLPKYLNVAECLLDIHMHQPGIAFHMQAPKCAKVEFEGSMDEFGRANDLKGNGLIGFESIPLLK